MAWFSGDPGGVTMRTRWVRRYTGPGAARYAAEFSIPGIAYASLVMSTIPSGRVSRMDTAEAQRAPGVLAVITPANAIRLPAPLAVEVACASSVSGATPTRAGTYSSPLLDISPPIHLPSEPRCRPPTSPGGSCVAGSFIRELLRVDCSAQTTDST